MKPQIKYFNTALIPIYFGIVSDEKRFNREMKRLGLKDTFSDNVACTHTYRKYKKKSKLKLTLVIVTIKKEYVKKSSKHALAAMLAHEAYHVVVSALEAMGEHKPGEEFVAYSIQYFTQLMLDELKCPSH